VALALPDHLAVGVARAVGRGGLAQQVEVILVVDLCRAAVEIDDELGVACAGIVEALPLGGRAHVVVLLCATRRSRLPSRGLLLPAHRAASTKAHAGHEGGEQRKCVFRKIHDSIFPRPIASLTPASWPTIPAGQPRSGSPQWSAAPGQVAARS